MYPEIQKAVEKGEVLLEWDSTKGQAPAPLLKDIYAKERRRAKVLNFSIAYGKTAHGYFLLIFYSIIIYLFIIFY